MRSSRQWFDLAQHSLPNLGLTLFAGTLLASATAFADAPQAPMVTPGFTLSVFVRPPTGASKPNSIALVKGNVWIGYGNEGKPDGTQNAQSTIVEYDASGNVLRTLTITGHNDGLKLDPKTGNLWALQNEDGNTDLEVINPASGEMQRYTFQSAAHGGGYDDVAFLRGAAYVSASNPTLDQAQKSHGPSLVRVALTSQHTITVTPVLSGTPTARDMRDGKATELNLTDPDSLLATPSGDLLLDSQGDGELVRLRHGSSMPADLWVLPLMGGVQVDDTTFVSAPHGYLLVSDTPANVVYKISAPDWTPGSVFSAMSGVDASTNPPSPAIPGYVGELDMKSGALLPAVANMVAPHGMVFVPSE